MKASEIRELTPEQLKRNRSLRRGDDALRARLRDAEKAFEELSNGKPDAAWREARGVANALHQELREHEVERLLGSAEHRVRAVRALLTQRGQSQYPNPARDAVRLFEGDRKRRSRSPDK